MNNIIKLVKEEFGELPFKHRGIYITEELIIAAVEILNEAVNKELPQGASNSVAEKTPYGLDKAIKQRLNNNLRTSNIISDVLNKVGVVKVGKIKNERTGRWVKSTKLLYII